MTASRIIYRFRDPRRGEIIFFRTPAATVTKCGVGGTFVKRVIGLPGDVVEVRVRNVNGYAYINGKELDEPYIRQSRKRAVEDGPMKVPSGSYFVWEIAGASRTTRACGAPFRAAT